MYVQSMRGLPFSLPNMPVQFADYAAWQHKTRGSWIEKHGGYWKGRLIGAKRIRLFSNENVTQETRPKVTVLPIHFGEALTAEVHEFSRRKRTTPMMSVLTAYVAVVLRWSNETALVMPFITTGRARKELENTIGFFGSILFLRIDLFSDDSFVDLLTRVTEEYGVACEHDDSGRIAAQTPPSEFAGNPLFNWFSREFRLRPNEGYVPNAEVEGLCEADSIKLEPFAFSFGPFEDKDDDVDDIGWDKELAAFLYETNEGIIGNIAYRADRVTLGTIERFERNFRFFVERLVREPGTCVAAMSCDRDNVVLVEACDKRANEP